MFIKIEIKFRLYITLKYKKAIKFISNLTKYINTYKIEEFSLYC